MAWGARLRSRWTVLILALAGISVAAGALAYSLYALLGGGNPVLSTPSRILFVGILLTVASPVVAVIVVFFAVSHRDVIEEVFLVHRSGLLLVHFSKTLKAEKDRDVVVAMLTALQSFVQEAFSRGTPRSLRQMDFGDRKIVIRQGDRAYLAVALRGRPSLTLRPRMRRTLEMVEEAYGNALAVWNGNSDRLAGADDVIRDGLLAGGIRGIVQTWIAIGTGLLARFDWLRPRRELAAKAPPEPGSDPQRDAAALLGRPELQSLRPEFRDMIGTALRQIEDGRFTLVGVANVHMAIALQKVQRPAMAGWWNEVLQTVRQVLRTWPWDPDSQAWVREGVTPAASAQNPPLVQDVLGNIATRPLDMEPAAPAPRTTIGKPPVPPREPPRRTPGKRSRRDHRRSPDD